jgi:hypothetical protein
MMLNSNVFIVLLLFLVRAAIDIAPDLLRMVLGASRGRPDEDLAAFSVVMRAKELSPSMAIDLGPRPPLLFSVGNRSLNLLVGVR